MCLFFYNFFLIFVFLGYKCFRKIFSLIMSYFYNCPWTRLCALLFLNLCFVHVAHTPHQKKKKERKKKSTSITCLDLLLNKTKRKNTPFRRFCWQYIKWVNSNFSNLDDIPKKIMVWKHICTLFDRVDLVRSVFVCSKSHNIIPLYRIRFV